MKLLVLAVGKLKEPWARAGCEEYARRIAHYVPLEIIEVTDAKAMAARLPDRHRRIVLDEQGTAPTSKELAARLGRWMTMPIAGCTLLVGGPDGLPPALRAAADETLALSRLTLPHRLARLILLEQLYRGLTILRGEPYHRE